MNWFKLIDSAALLIQLVAATIMFSNSPDNNEKGEHTFNDYENFRQIDIKKNRWLKFGFGLLVIGVAISLLSTLCK